MRRNISSLSLALMFLAPLASCGKSASFSTSKDAPSQTVKAFLKAIRREDCEKVWDYFSEASHEAIIKESETLKSQGYGRGADGKQYTDAFEPKKLYCKVGGPHGMQSFEPDSARLAEEHPDYAIVTVKRGEGTDFLIPGFFPTKTVYHEQTFRLVKEDGEWKIDIAKESERRAK